MCVYRISIIYSLFLYGAVLSMAPHIRLCFQPLCACLYTSLPFAADDSFSVSSSFLHQLSLFYITAAAVLSYIPPPRERPNVLQNVPIILFCTAYYFYLLFPFLIHYSRKYPIIPTLKKNPIIHIQLNIQLFPHARRSFEFRCFSDSTWFFKILRLRLSCSRHAEQKS